MGIRVCDHFILPPKGFLHPSLERVCGHSGGMVGRKGGGAP